KYEGLEGVKFLIVQPLDRYGEPEREPAVAADGVAMAGPGDIVTTVAAREAALALPVTFVPVDLAITSIVDEVSRLAS
ncbi:MAG: EutN/CcmL family microcompartment protein, partial [Ardenticatenaceae bacterium]